MINGKVESYGMPLFELELEKLKPHEEVQESGEFIKFKFLAEEKKREREAMPESYPNLIKPKDEWGSSVSKIFLPLSRKNLLGERAKSWWEELTEWKFHGAMEETEAEKGIWVFPKEKKTELVYYYLSPRIMERIEYLKLTSVLTSWTPAIDLWKVVKGTEGKEKYIKLFQEIYKETKEKITPRLKVIEILERLEEKVNRGKYFDFDDLEEIVRAIKLSDADENVLRKINELLESYVELIKKKEGRDIIEEYYRLEKSLPEPIRTKRPAPDDYRRKIIIGISAIISKLSWEYVKKLTDDFKKGKIKGEEYRKKIDEMLERSDEIVISTSEYLDIKFDWVKYLKVQ